MIKHIKDLKRFDFTSNCRNCQFRKELGVLEYCCSFVYELLQEQRLVEVKKTILDYVLVDDKLDNVKPSNLLFTDNTEWVLTLKVKSNLIDDKIIVANELKKAIDKSPFFKECNVSYLRKDNDTLLSLGEYLQGGVCSGR